MNAWIDFYKPFFATPEAARSFVESLEKNKPSDPRYPATVMMHQAQRLISIADDIDVIRPEQYSLKLFFLVICTETMSKLFQRSPENCESRHAVRFFFDQFISDHNQEVLTSAFKKPYHPKSTIETVADCLYDVRADVVLEGKHWEFKFKENGTPMLNLDPEGNVYIVSIDYAELRHIHIIVQGCIKAIQDYA